MMQFEHQLGGADPTLLYVITVPQQTPNFAFCSLTLRETARRGKKREEKE